MEEEAAPRPSIDDEAAPLLENEPPAPSPPEPSLLDRLAAHSTTPLTPLSRLLLLLALTLLILSSIFVGLFAGAQHRIADIEHRPAETETETVVMTSTRTETRTEVRTTSLVVTTTRVEEKTQTTTVTATKTIVSTPPPTPPPKIPCLTSECIRLSASILSSLDTTIDPCEDFFEFASGGWRKEHPLPADKGILTNFELLSIENKRIIESILTTTPSTPPSPADARTLKKLHDLYTSCTDEGTLAARGQDVLIDLVRELESVFDGEVGENLVDGREGQRVLKEKPPKGLTAALAWLHSKGIDALFNFVVDGDVGVDPDFMTLWFYQPDLGLPSKEYYEEEDILELYTSVLTRIFVALTPSPPSPPTTSASPAPTSTTTRNFPWPWPRPTPSPPDGPSPPSLPPVNNTKHAHDLAESVVQLEQALARAGADLDVLLQDPLATYNPRLLPELQSTLPEISFPTYFSAFAPRAFPERVIVTHPPYAEALHEILTYTPPAVLRAHFSARLVLSLAPYLSPTTELWLARRRLEEELAGLKPGAMPDRGEWCLGVVEGAMGFAAGRPFVERVFGGDAREKGTKVIQDVIQAFEERLPELTWMDKNSSEAANEKASAITVKVGYPLSPNTTDASSIERYYGTLAIHNSTFFENVLNARKLEEIYMWAKVGKQRNKAEWEMIPSEVNAYFNPSANEIVFPAGILRPPFFDPSWPTYLSYGAFGSVAAHELTHAFDNAGRLYNQHGKLEEWWTNVTSIEYDKRASCISRQYSEYWVDDGKGGKAYVNGNLTSGENIGDAGIALSYRAWEAQSDASAPADAAYDFLPGLNFTKEQLFFISFARVWSANVKPATALQRVRTDPHSPARFRTNGPLSNLPAFARAFNCSVGSPLNPSPEQQCRLW